MRMLIVNPIAGCGYALKVMEQVQSVLTARNLPFRGDADGIPRLRGETGAGSSRNGLRSRLRHRR